MTGYDSTVLNSSLATEIKNYVNPSKNPYNYFNRFRVPSTDPFMSNIGYVFFTKPNINLNEDNIGLSNFLTALQQTSFGKSILGSLSTEYISSPVPGNFIKILSNSVLNFETKDTTLATADEYENFIGYKFNVPSTIIDSITADTITLNFLEYDDLRVTNLIKAWVEYISNVKRGYFTAKKAFIQQKIIDYASSIYYFLCGPDGHSIKFFTKLTGIYPVNIPYSSFSWDMTTSPDIKKVSVTFSYQIKEDMDLEIIDDFIKLTNNPTSNIILGDEYKDSWANQPVIYNGDLYFV